VTVTTDDRDYPEGWAAETAEAVKAPPVWRVGNHQRQNLYHGDRYEGVMFRTEAAELAVAALNHLQSGTCEELAEVAGAKALRDLAEHLESTGHEDGIAADMRVSVLARERAERMEAGE